MYKQKYVLEYFEEGTQAHTYNSMGYVCGTYSVQKTKYISYKKMDDMYLNYIKTFNTSESAETYRQKLINEVVYCNVYLSNVQIRIKTLPEDEYNLIKDAIDNKKKSTRIKTKEVVYTGIHISVINELKSKYVNELLNCTDNEKKLLLTGKVEVLEEILNIIEVENKNEN